MKNMKIRVKRYIVPFFMLISILVASLVVCNSTIESVYAANLPTIGDFGSVVCKKSARVEIPWGYKNCSYSSSNEKVATVNSKGILKALRLGETKITIKSGSEKTVYEITVVPGKKSDVRLNHEILLSGQKTQLKLVSDKYDTSQVRLKFHSAFSENELTETGKCKGIIENDWVSEGTVTYWYGSFSKKTTLSVYNPEVFFDAMLRNNEDDRSYDSTARIDASRKYSALSNKDMYFNNKNATLKWARKSGLEFYLDGKRMPEQVVYEPGKHVITIVAGKQKYEKKFNVTYSIQDVFVTRDTTGFSLENQRVFNAAFSAVDQVILDGMSEEQKVRAIHDYLIYHANYAGENSKSETWVYGAEGVLLHGEGVCQSYAIAFYMMAKAAGLDCHYVVGYCSSLFDAHAWNRVKVDGVWYYIDCTWDDSAEDGSECHLFYLSRDLWLDHTAEEERDLAQDKKMDWTVYYLTGKGYVDY